MTSIVNFKEEIKSKSMDRPSDVILKSFNRFSDAKMSGALNDDELSKIIVLIGDLFANKIKKGKVSEEDIEQVESYITSFTGEHKDNYFSFNHKDLDRAAKTFLEGDYVAVQEYESRNIVVKPEEGYSKGLRIS